MRRKGYSGLYSSHIGSCSAKASARLFGQQNTRRKTIVVRTGQDRQHVCWAVILRQDAQEQLWRSCVHGRSCTLYLRYILVGEIMGKYVCNIRLSCLDRMEQRDRNTGHPLNRQTHSRRRMLFRQHDTQHFHDMLQQCIHTLTMFWVMLTLFVPRRSSTSTLA